MRHPSLRAITLFVAVATSVVTLIVAFPRPPEPTQPLESVYQIVLPGKLFKSDQPLAILVDEDHDTISGPMPAKQAWIEKGDNDAAGVFVEGQPEYAEVLAELVRRAQLQLASRPQAPP